MKPVHWFGKQIKSVDWFLYDRDLRHERVERQSYHHIEAIQLICKANQVVAAFYMMATLAFNELSNASQKFSR